MSQEEQSRFEHFVVVAKADIDTYRKNLQGDGSFQYLDQVTQLEKLQINLSHRMMTYLFGERLGDHNWQKFSVECNHNLLRFFRQIHHEARFFIIYELKNNDMLFANS